MEEYTNLLFEVDHEIGIVTINKPKSLNALDRETMEELELLCDIIAQDTAIKVVILTGAGNKSFVAGADIAEMEKMSPLEGRNWAKFGQSVFNKIENLPQPVIAAINGFALGGGCELAMACDIRIASIKAKFGQPEVTLGITPGFGGTQRLPRLVGKGIAKEMLFTGNIIDAQTALRIGLVNYVVPEAELLSTVKEMANKILAAAPIAVKLCKSAINKGVDINLETALAYEAEIFGLCFSTVDQKEGMVAFLEKRKPEFTCK